MKTTVVFRILSEHNLICFFLILSLFLFDKGVSRPLMADGLISDGSDIGNPNHSLIQMMRSTSEDSEKPSSSSSCEQMYGFLPCSDTAWGHLFLILVYEYLLFHGESYVASGGEMVFKILGPGVFGASVFQIIGSLPEALILLVSGLSSNDELGEEFVLTGVGLLAGSTILMLTLLWGTCIILSSNDFPKKFNSTTYNRKFNPFERLLISQWPEYGAITDWDTSFTARIMLLSAFPLSIILIPRIFRSSFMEERVFLLIALTTSIIFLFSFFFYQFFEPWIQRRRLLYIKHEQLVVDILKHVQNQTLGKLLTENGSPNTSTIKRLFDERDQDGDKAISFTELKEFLQEIKFRRLQSDKINKTNEIMKEFDVNDDQKITMDEFVDGMTKWLDETKDTMNKPYHTVKSLKDLYKVLEPWIQKKREEREEMKRLIPDILEHFQSSAYGRLLSEEGTPDLPALKRLFKGIDLDNDESISVFELMMALNNIQFGKVPHDAEVASSRIMEAFDVNGDHLINEEEFVTGLSKWLSTTYNHHESEKEEDDNYQRTWEQTDKLIEDKFIDKSPFAWIKAICLLFLGIVILGVLAEPLIHSVRGFSKAASLPSFYIAFVFVPLATNARLAVSAIKESRRKKLHTTSLTLSEIYGTVFMNNILGLAVLLSLIYFRGMTWAFSAEVFVVLVVSLTIGFLSSFSTIFPVWISLLAYSMYPLSLVLVHVLGDFDWFL